MCGIAGVISGGSDAAAQSQHIRRMVETLHHRGPDDTGFLDYGFTSGPQGFAVHLGMSRLAIIDRQHGRQPMGGSCKVFFNGEIYNHHELRDVLSQCYGSEPLWTFQTQCDTEVIAKAFEEWGPQFVGELDGMFAIAIWDTKQDRLYLYRDRIGKKPLYYYHDPCRKLLLFGSEIKAILAHPGYVKRPNWNGLYHYLALQYVPEPATAFAGIRCLPPGYMACYDPPTSTFKETPYFAWDTNGQPRLDAAHAKASLQETVTQAVDKRLESEVPIGVYLSGGIDSAIVTALAARSPNRPAELHSFTMAFPEEQYNEAPLARITAERCGTIHHVEIVQPMHLREMAERIVDQYDQPFGDCSAIPTMMLAQLSKKYITVALTGDGGDEAFGGYPRYWMSLGEQREYFKYMQIWPPGLRHDLMCPFWHDELDDIETEQWLLDHAAHGPAEDPWNRLMYLDAVTYLPNDIIVKMERATMAHSIEARCPFLDSDVLALSFSIPSSLKSNGGGKAILKETFADLVAPEILTAPKRGFAVPMGEWFRQPAGLELLRDTLGDDDLTGQLFEEATLSRVVTAHMAGRGDYGHGIWIAVMLAMWWKKHFGSGA